MTRRKASDMEEDEDYDPYDSFDEGRRVRQRGESGSGGVVVRSSRGRPVKVSYGPSLPVSPAHTDCLRPAVIMGGKKCSVVDARLRAVDLLLDRPGSTQRTQSLMTKGRRSSRSGDPSSGRAPSGSRPASRTLPTCLMTTTPALPRSPERNLPSEHLQHPLPPQCTTQRRAGCTTHGSKAWNMFVPVAEGSVMCSQ